MKARFDRRAVLGAALGIAAQLTLPRPARAAGRAPALRSEPLGGDLTLISGVGANVVALAKDDGVLLVDSGAAAQRRSLLDELRRLPGKGRVRTLVNTHWHAEQCGGNEAFGKAGAAILAHDKTRQRLSIGLWQPQTQQYLPPLPEAGWPTKTFHRSESLEFAGRRVHCGHLLEAHTDGDIYVHFPDADVLVVGDVLAAADRDPELDWFGGGWLGGRVDALAQLLKLADAATRVVPAQGPVVSRKELEAEHDMLAALFDRLAGLVRKGFTTEDMLASKVLETTGRQWHDGAKFLYAAHKGLWAHHNTLSHDIV